MKLIAGGVAVFLIIVAVYIPVLENGFVNWDDDICVYENIHIRSLSLPSLYWMLTAFHAGNWHPLTWLSHALVYSLWGLNPRGHHLVNIIAHSLNASLLFLVVIRLLSVRSTNAPAGVLLPTKIIASPQDLMIAAITALLFGLHPVHVESVAWVTERKGLLCQFFLLGSLLSYLRYAVSNRQRNRVLWLCATFVLFLCAIMSKPMAITFPIILLLLDVYPLGRAGWHLRDNSMVLAEKIPFCLVSIASAIVTVMAEHSAGALQSFEHVDVPSQLVHGLTSLTFYAGKILWPQQLVPFYPLSSDAFTASPLFSVGVVTAIIVCSLRLARKGNPLVLVCWLYYAITLLPVLGIVRIGSHAAADRFAYLPALSIYLLMAICAMWLWERSSASQFDRFVKVILLAGIGGVMLLLGRGTLHQIGIWKSSETLWNSVINAFPNRFAIAYNNRAEAYLEEGRVDDAIEGYKQAIIIYPPYFEAHTNLGNAYLKKGMVDDAMAEFNQALTIKPDYAKAHCNLGAAYMTKNRYDRAIVSFTTALTLMPDYEEAHYNLGAVYANQGKLDEAIAHFEHALRIRPSYMKAHYGLGMALYSRGDFKSALVHLDTAAKLGYSVNPALMEALKPYR